MELVTPLVLGRFDHLEGHHQGWQSSSHRAIETDLNHRPLYSPVATQLVMETLAMSQVSKVVSRIGVVSQVSTDARFLKIFVMVGLKVARLTGSSLVALHHWKAALITSVRIEL